MSNYPLLDLFLSILYFFLWVLWIMLLFWIITDIFRSRDLSGWGKAGWVLVVILIPLIGVLAYLIVRGDSMHERQVRDAQAQDEAFRAYVRDAAATNGNSRGDELTTLTNLHDRGVLSDEEFQRAKENVLTRPTVADDVPRQTASREANRTLYASRLLLCRAGDWARRTAPTHGTGLPRNHHLTHPGIHHVGCVLRLFVIMRLEVCDACLARSPKRTDVLGDIPATGAARA